MSRSRSLALWASIGGLLVMGYLIAAPAEAQIPVTDIAHIIETIAQYIQQLLDYINQIEQLYHDAVNLAKLPEAIWRDAGVKTGEFIWGRSMRLSGSPEDLVVPPEFETLAYLWPDIASRMRKVFGVGVFVPSATPGEEPGEFETNLERQHFALTSEQELFARGMSVLGDHLRNMVDGVIALKALREAVERNEGAEVQAELLQHFQSFQVEEQLLERQLELMRANLEIVPRARAASELGQALSTLELIFRAAEAGEGKEAGRPGRKRRGLRAVE